MENNQEANPKGCGEKNGRGLIKILLQQFPGGAEEDHDKTYVRIVGLWKEICIQDISHVKQKRWSLLRNILLLLGYSVITLK